MPPQLKWQAPAGAQGHCDRLHTTMSSDSESPSSQGGASSGEEFEAASSEAPSSSSSSGEEYDGEEERPRPRGPMRGRGSGAAAAAAARRPAAAAPPAKRQRAGPQPKLTDLLKSASKEQLVSLVVHLNDDAGGELEGRIAALLPPPDLSVSGRRAPFKPSSRAVGMGSTTEFQSCSGLACMDSGAIRGLFAWFASLSAA